MIGPSQRLLALLAAWTAASLVAVYLPALVSLTWLALAAVLLVTIYDASMLRRSPALVALRRLPERATVGQELEVTIELGNPGSEAQRVELFDETAPDLHGGDAVFRDVVVAPRDSETLRYRARPARRGNRRFGSIVTVAESPLGLLRRSQTHDTDDLLRVFPDALSLRREGLLDLRELRRRFGLRPVQRRGEGMEFESLRDYVEGDDPRRVHWGASARRGRPILKLHQHESNHAVIVAVDTSRLMGVRTATRSQASSPLPAEKQRSKLDHAVDAALALSFSALLHGDRAGLAAFDRRVHELLTPRASRRQLEAIVERLQPLEPRLVEADYRELVRTLCARQRRRALVVILTDFAEIDPDSLVLPLLTLARQHRVVVAALRDPVFQGLDPQAAEGGATLPLYRRLVLDDLARQRELTLAQLRRRGILTIDALPETISPLLVQQYLGLRFGQDR